MTENQGADLAALRDRITALESGGAAHRHQGTTATTPVRLGPEAIDRALPGGGIMRGAVHEVTGTTADLGAATGFAAVLAGRAAGPCGTVLWCTHRGDLYCPGLAAFGLDSSRLVMACVEHPRNALWVAEEGLRAGLAAVVGETPVDPVAGRRLELAARASGSLCLVLKRYRQTGPGMPAETRWRIAAVPGTPLPGGAPGRARWRLALTRCRAGMPHQWTVEWCHETHRFTLVAALAHRPQKAG